MGNKFDNAIAKLEAVLDAPGTNPRQIVAAARALVQLHRAHREFGATAALTAADDHPRRIVIPDFDERWPPGSCPGDNRPAQHD